MDKQTVISHFGSPKATAEALGITQQAVGQWPDTLTERIENRVLAALARRGEAVPAGWISGTPAAQQQAA